MVVGLGYRREMADWDMSAIHADFYEVAPENWTRCSTEPLQRLIQAGFPIYLHGVSLNLGGHAPLNLSFLGEVRSLIHNLGITTYSDHLAASGDAHQLHDLFPIPFTKEEANRVANRIKQAQDFLGMQIAVENSTWYTNIGDMPEPEFINEVLQKADCRLLLDVNNLAVNFKNHQLVEPQDFVEQLDLSRVCYVHVAGHEFDERFTMYLDTHSRPVETSTRELAQRIQQQAGIPILLEWDNDIPDAAQINQELLCLKSSIATYAV